MPLNPLLPPVVMTPPDRGSPRSCNPDALRAWHRAHGSIVTLVSGAGGDRGATDHETWPGFMAVDAEVAPLLSMPGADRSLGRLKALARDRLEVVRFRRPPQPAILLSDRDGTIIEDRHYLSQPDEVTLIPTAAEGLLRLARAGWRLVVLSNQSGVAEGIIAPAALEQIHQRLRQLLAQPGVALAGIYVCPHSPMDACDCRKPADGLARRAAWELGLDLRLSVMVGDKAADVLLARQLGVPAFLVLTGSGSRTLADGGVTADYAVDGLDELARICLHPAGLAEAAELHSA